MTVHASKGLEAPIVFLVDGGSKAFTPSHMPKLRLLEQEHGEPPMPAWVPLGDLSNSLTQADATRIQSLAEQEYRRLLYVAMTRAADRLTVCGYRGIRPNTDTWHAMISAAMTDSHPHVSAATFSGPDDSWAGIKWRVPRVERSFERLGRIEQTARQESIPPSLDRPLPPRKQLPRPLSPSGVGTIVDDGADDLLIASPLFVEKGKPDRSLQKGRLLHRMLQTLPDVPRGEQADAAVRYTKRAASFWPEAERQQLVDSVVKLLRDPSLESVFSTHAQAEVSVMGTLTIGGVDHAVSGRVDRMAVFDERVVVLDYKTNRVPPQTAEAIPFAHKAQLAFFREILAPLYPGKRIDCVLVYTETAPFTR
jgi:ATP-dependent helicase/nuclease subunit A